MDAACGARRVDDRSFDEAVGASAAPALVYVVRAPCDACPLRQPALAPGTPAGPGRVRRFCVEATASPQVVARYRIADFPTVLLLCGGSVTRRFVGRLLPGEVEALLRTAIPVRPGRA